MPSTDINHDVTRVPWIYKCTFGPIATIATISTAVGFCLGLWLKSTKPKTIIKTKKVFVEKPVEVEKIVYRDRDSKESIQRTVVDVNIDKAIEKIKDEMDNFDPSEEFIKKIIKKMDNKKLNDKIEQIVTYHFVRAFESKDVERCGKKFAVGLMKDPGIRASSKSFARSTVLGMFLPSGLCGKKSKDKK